MKAMGTIDPSLRIKSCVSKTLLWDVDGQLPEGEEFRTEFQLREQNFRKGNSKVTLFCVVESSMNINRIKFMDPVQSMLLSKNIWIKPDYYSTKVVSSPGFFTLLHPRLTHKKSFVQHLQNALQNTRVDAKEDIVVDWQTKHPGVITDPSIPIPTFHVETSQKKWGKIQTEVISVHCSTDDAKYMKYLLTAACTQNKLATGLFVPTGLHLLEGKEVLTNLLQEQFEFIKQTTSFHMEGISRVDMEAAKDGGKSTRELLAQGPGVQGIEPTYQTDHRGQWVLVVNAQAVQSLQAYIQKHIQAIYRNRQTKQLRLIRHSTDNHVQGYRVILLDSFSGSVGTYAEALTRRFSPSPTLANGSSLKTAAHRSSSVGTQHQSSTGTSHGLDDTRRDEFPPLWEAPKSQMAYTTSLTGLNQTQVPTTHTRGTSVPKGIAHVNDEDSEVLSQCQVTPSSPTDTGTMGDKLRWEQNFAKMEKNLENKLNTMDMNTTLQMSALEKRIEKNVETIMETKMMDISVLIANMVTRRLMTAMGKAAKSKAVTTEPCSELTDSPDIQTDGQSSQTQDSVISSPSLSLLKDLNTQRVNTQQMIQELNNIVNTPSQTTDPPHDNFTQGSEPSNQ